MSYVFSRALVAEYSVATCSAGAPFAPSSGNPTPQAYLSPDKMTEFSRLSRFGMMFAPLTDDLGEELLTWYQAGFHARTSAQREKEPELTAHAPDSGKKWPASLAKYDLVSSSWKTRQCSLDGDLEPFLETWPRWGTMRNGVSYQRKTPVLRTHANESGLLRKTWATPSATDGSRGGTITEKMTGRSLAQQVNTPEKWPTPKANDAEKRGNFDTSNPRNGLPAAVKMWPTPTASLGSKGGRITPRKGREGGNLIEAVSKRMFATPTARDWRSGKASQATMDRNSRPLSEQIGGQLNPQFVEWLMGWPIGWTSLEPMRVNTWDAWRQAFHSELIGSRLVEMAKSPEPLFGLGVS